MENKKLKLDELKLQSFITELEKENSQTLQVQGGIGLDKLNPIQFGITQTEKLNCWTLDL